MLINQYKIIDKCGKVILYVPNPVQEDIHDIIGKRSIFICSRQRGTHTALLIDAIEKAHAEQGLSIFIFAPNKDMRDSYADRLHFLFYQSIGNRLQLIQDTKRKIVFENYSSIEVSCNEPCGANIHYLLLFHSDILEYEKKGIDIQDTFNIVDTNGIIAITINAPIKHSQSRCIALSAYMKQTRYELYFYPWWENITTEIVVDIPLSPNIELYFRELDIMTGGKVSKFQKDWYAQMAEEIGFENMKREYPSFIEEALFG